MTSFSDWVASVPFLNKTPTPVAPPVPSIPKLADAIQAVASSIHVDANVWAEAMSPFMVSSGIMTPKRIAAFLGQVAVESARFTALTENLNYSEAALLASWPSHFSAADAAAYARQPEKIANRAYANRMGNGDEASGDGWRYRGAGLIQLTGKDSQARFGASCNVVGDVGDCLRTNKGAAQSACWFWATNNLNPLADGWQITELTKRINGGENGLAVRISLSSAALKVVS